MRVGCGLTTENETAASSSHSNAAVVQVQTLRLGAFDLDGFALMLAAAERFDDGAGRSVADFDVR